MIIRLRKAFNGVYEIKVSRVVNFIFGQTAENLEQKYARLFCPRYFSRPAKAELILERSENSKEFFGFLGGETAYAKTCAN